MAREEVLRLAGQQDREVLPAKGKLEPSGKLGLRVRAVAPDKQEVRGRVVQRVKAVLGVKAVALGKQEVRGRVVQRVKAVALGKLGLRVREVALGKPEARGRLGLQVLRVKQARGDREVPGAPEALPTLAVLTDARSMEPASTLAPPRKTIRVKRVSPPCNNSPGAPTRRT